MPRRCTVCAHPKLREIDRTLARSKHEPYRTIAVGYGLSETALKRHAAEHLPASLVKANGAREVANADSILTQVTSLQDTTLRVLDSALAADDHRLAMTAVREARANLELLAKLTGELAQVNILVAPMWQTLRVAIWQALEPYPEAADALAAALEDAEP